MTPADSRVDLADEAKHFKLIGTTASGEPTMILELMEQELVRGDRALVADPDGG